MSSFAQAEQAILRTAVKITIHLLSQLGLISLGALGCLSEGSGAVCICMCVYPCAVCMSMGTVYLCVGCMCVVCLCMCDVYPCMCVWYISVSMQYACGCQYLYCVFVACGMCDYVMHMWYVCIHMYGVYPVSTCMCCSAMCVVCECAHV